MKRLIKVTGVIDGTMGFLALLAALLLVFMMLSVSAEVVARSLFGRSQVWMMEIIEFSLLYTTFLGTAWLLKSEGHVKMDIIVNRLKPRTRAMLDVITSVIGAIVCLVVAWYGIEVVWRYFQSGYRFSTQLEPPAFLIVGIIPIGTFLLFIQFLRRAYGYLESWRAS